MATSAEAGADLRRALGELLRRAQGASTVCRFYGLFVGTYSTSAISDSEVGRLVTIAERRRGCGRSPDPDREKHHR